MKFCKYQRSRSFTDLGSRSLRFRSFKIISKGTGLVETKLHIEPQWCCKIKVCSWDQGYMTKMANMPIYGKKDLKFLISVVHEWLHLELPKTKIARLA